MFWGEILICYLWCWDYVINVATGSIALGNCKNNTQLEFFFREKNAVLLSSFFNLNFIMWPLLLRSGHVLKNGIAFPSLIIISSNNTRISVFSRIKSAQRICWIKDQFPAILVSHDFLCPISAHTFFLITFAGKSWRFAIDICFQKQPPTGALRKRWSENMHQIYRRKSMPKCDFNKVAKQFYRNHTSARVLSCKLAAYFQDSFS